MLCHQFSFLPSEAGLSETHPSLPTSGAAEDFVTVISGYWIDSLLASNDVSASFGKIKLMRSSLCSTKKKSNIYSKPGGKTDKLEEPVNRKLIVTRS